MPDLAWLVKCFVASVAISTTARSRWICLSWLCACVSQFPSPTLAFFCWPPWYWPRGLDCIHWHLALALWPPCGGPATATGCAHIGVLPERHGTCDSCEPRSGRAAAGWHHPALVLEGCGGRGGSGSWSSTSATGWHHPGVRLHTLEANEASCVSGGGCNHAGSHWTLDTELFTCDVGGGCNQAGCAPPARDRALPVLLEDGLGVSHDI
jgi:hypothetical protein